MKRFTTIILSPLVCLGILAGVYRDARGRVQPADAEPYHRAAHDAVAGIPYQINGWVGKDEDIPEAAVKLLRPNCMISRTYVDPSDINRSVGLLVVQCKDSRDMIGHYPPVCYPAHGYTKVSEERRDWRVGGETIPGTEYVFNHDDGISKYQVAVCNFMVVPGVGIVRDMTGIERAAQDYQRRYFGAAQFQLTMNAAMPQFDRDRVFAEVIGGNLQVIETLKQQDSASAAGGNK